MTAFLQVSIVISVMSNTNITPLIIILVAEETDKEKVSVVYWRIPKEGDKDDYQWGDIGIAHDGNYDTDLQKISAFVLEIRFL